MTKEEIKEIIYNSTLDYSKINIQNGRIKGHITVLLNEEDFTKQELQELENMPYFYIDEYEIDINKYYAESLEVTLLNENVKNTFYDVEFQFSTSGKEVA